MDLTPSNLVLNVLDPCLPRIHSPFNIGGGGNVQWIKSSIRPSQTRMGFCLCFCTCLRKCPGLSVGQQPQTAKGPDVTSAGTSPFRCLLQHAMAHRSVKGRWSRYRRYFKARHCLLAFSALVLVSISRYGLSYKHAPQLPQLGSRRCQRPWKLVTYWRLLGTALNTLRVLFDQALGRVRRALRGFKVIV